MQDCAEVKVSVLKSLSKNLEQMRNPKDRRSKPPQLPRRCATLRVSAFDGCVPHFAMKLHGRLTPPHYLLQSCGQKLTKIEFT